MSTHTPTTITTPEKLRRELATVRERGYAEDKGEQIQDANCVAAPVFDSEQAVVASIVMTGPASRVLLKRLPALAEQTRRAATAVTARLAR